MRVGAEDKKKLVWAGVAGFCAILAVGYLCLTLFGGPSAPAPVPAVPVAASKPAAAAAIPGFRPTAAAAATKGGTTTGQLDPTLHMDGMLAAEAVMYTGTGRNIFAAGAAQERAATLVPAVQKFPPRPPTPGPPTVFGPPPLPPINLKFFGTATQRGVRRALLLSGDDVLLASAGDIVQRRYKIVSIAANSMVVMDLPNSNQQTLPLVAN